MSWFYKTIQRMLVSRRQRLLYLGHSDRQAEYNAIAFAHDCALRRVIMEHRIDCVIDVGANVGQFARRLRGVGYTGRIASIEPGADTFAMLRTNLSKDVAWTGFNYAVGAEHGTAELNLLPDSVLNSLSMPDPVTLAKIGATATTICRQKTTVNRLDDVFEELIGPTGPKARLFLKTDTQGFDHAVLAGAAGRALPAASVLQLEMAVERLYADSQNWKSTLEGLSDAGWGVIGLYPAAHDQSTGTVLEFDCLLTRR